MSSEEDQVIGLPVADGQKATFRGSPDLAIIWPKSSPCTLRERKHENLCSITLRGRATLTGGWA